MYGKYVIQNSRDHPRVCGEKVCASAPYELIAGSPPRVRGKVVVVKLPQLRIGITPACAGKSNIDLRPTVN